MLRLLAYVLLVVGMGGHAVAQSVGTCQTGIAFADLDINNVRARLYNTGGLFWKGAAPTYNVPSNSSSTAIFAHSIWVGGLVDGELRMAASTYGPWEFWPGPLDADGNPPVVCSEYDRMYKVSARDIQDFERGLAPTVDLLNWPHHLGAPVLDGDGKGNNYDLFAGDRPDIRGDQAIWWVINDMGNHHTWSRTRPLGIEVRVLAYAFSRLRDVENTTYYRYTIANRSDKTIEDARIGIFTDANLGDGSDDYVGCDSVRSIAFTWNGDDFDGGSSGYGDLPPAVGTVLLASPATDMDGNQLGMATCTSWNADATAQGDPDGAEEAFGYLQGRWRTGEPMTYGGSGRGFSDRPTTFIYPGNPPEFWSEENTVDGSARNTPGDRRMLMSTAPFDMPPGFEGIISYAIVWSQGTDRFDSVQRLKFDAILARLALGGEYTFPEAIDPPRVDFEPDDGSVALSWGYEPTDNNYEDSYDEWISWLAERDLKNKTYTFEGYNVYRYDGPSREHGELVATFDVINGVTRVVDLVDATIDPPVTALSATGTDSGLQHSIRIDGLLNQTDYYYGVEAYAYNPHTSPQIFKSAVSRITVRPEIPLPTLDHTSIVPNPYKGASDYEVSNLRDVVRIINLPEDADIRVYDLAGTLVRRLTKRGSGTSLDWDLMTDAGLPLASGMYLVHIDGLGLGQGERVIKFGVVKKRIQLDLY